MTALSDPRAYVDWLRGLEPGARAAEVSSLDVHLVGVGGYTAAEWLQHYWPAWAAPHQMPPEDDDWFTLFLRAGRGGGKTCAGTELTRRKVEAWRGPGVGHVALIAPVYAEIDEILVNGPSGLVTRAPPWSVPEWRPGKGHGGQLWWHELNVMGHCFTAEKPAQVEGLEYMWAWGDELRKWTPGRDVELYEALLPAMRQGRRPQMLFTSTPHATPLIAQLDAEARDHASRELAGESVPNRTVQRVWSTLANSANLPDVYLEKLVSQFGGTTKGRSVIGGELVLGDPLAVWQQDLIDRYAVSADEVPELDRLIIAVDNATEDGDASIEGGTIEARNRDGGRADTAIIVLGLGVNGHAYILGDLTVSDSPIVWASEICRCLDGADLWHGRGADVAVVERNAGGALIDTTVRLRAREMRASGQMSMAAEALPIAWVRAKEGKHTRADPVVTLYEGGNIHHVRFAGRDPLADLEFQMTKFRRGAKGWKKDRVDALVWGLFHLIVHPSGVADEVESRWRNYL